jgi:hypothetical protein
MNTTHEQLIASLTNARTLRTCDNTTIAYIAALIEHTVDLTRGVCAAHVVAHQHKIVRRAIDAHDVVAHVDADAIALRIVDDIDFDNIDVDVANDEEIATYKRDYDAMYAQTRDDHASHEYAMMCRSFNKTHDA